MKNPSYSPRLLFVTPHPLFSPGKSFFINEFHCTQEGKETDFFSFFLSDLYHLGADIHVVQPEYRRFFSELPAVEDPSVCSKLPGANVHMARDRIFYYSGDIDTNCDWDNIRISMALQREVIQYYIPMIQPDLIHCYDWMTGLIPAAANAFGIPCLFTIHDLKTKKIPLWSIEDMGIDAALFWGDLFYDRMPTCYEETRATNLADFLLSGVHAASHIDVTSSEALTELITSLNRNHKTDLECLLEKKYKNQNVSSISSHTIHTQAYIDIYENLLQQSIINPYPENEITKNEIMIFHTPSALSNLSTAHEMGI